MRFADVAELADALVSGSSEAIHVGSSPVIRTIQKAPLNYGVLFVWIMTGQFSGKPSNFALKTIINRFPNARHHPHQKILQKRMHFLQYFFIQVADLVYH